jgi:hypothetical protein
MAEEVLVRAEEADLDGGVVTTVTAVIAVDTTALMVIAAGIMALAMEPASTATEGVSMDPLGSTRVAVEA